MLDCYASERHYVDHIAPVWLGLPKSLRGAFLTRRPEILEHAASLGITAEIGLPGDNLTLVASYGDYRKTQGPVIYMEHGIGHSYSNDHPSYAGGRGKERVELFLCQHQLTADKNKKAYPDSKSVVIGTPKMDFIKKRGIKGRTVAISFHWDCKVAPESRSAFHHYKSGLIALSRAKDIELIAHAHPKVTWNQSLQRHYKNLGLEYVDSFDEVLDRADLYVIDNSSSAYEFAAAGRPVIHMNAPWYRKDVSHGIRFWDLLPGPTVDNPKQLLPAIRKIFEDPGRYEDRRAKAVMALYPHLGKSTPKAIQAIKDFIRC